MVAVIRALVVDDSAVARRLISNVLNAEPDIESETAANGRLALERMALAMPDVVVLDVEMPELDGLATLRRIKELDPDLPVIMCSAPTAEAGNATLDALAAGAADYVTKPSGSGGLAETLDELRTELVRRVRAVARLRGRDIDAGPVADAPARSFPPAVRPRRRSQQCAAVVVAVSTGGPQALAEVIPALPSDLAVPVLIVQHMPPTFTRLLAERLDGKSSVRVVEAQDGMAVDAGTVYVAPGDHHMRVVRRNGAVLIALDQEPPENSCRPAADPLFRSAAEVWGVGVFGVVLTGMGSDGTSGAQRIAERGGQVIAQDEATSVVWGMPGAVVRAGVAEREVPLAEVAKQIVRAASAGRSPIGV
ncbi:MAG: chemotaxis-specific protein-glutamate methyltransferase CheB [Acidimicrobiia bacterium]